MWSDGNAKQNYLVFWVKINEYTVPTIVIGDGCNIPSEQGQGSESKKGAEDGFELHCC